MVEQWSVISVQSWPVSSDGVGEWGCSGQSGVSLAKKGKNPSDPVGVASVRARMCVCARVRMEREKTRQESHSTIVRTFDCFLYKSTNSMGACVLLCSILRLLLAVAWEKKIDPTIFRRNVRIKIFFVILANYFYFFFVFLLFFLFCFFIFIFLIAFKSQNYITLIYT